MQSVKINRVDKSQDGSSQLDNKTASHYAIRQQKNQREYFSLRMHVLSNGLHDDPQSRKRLLAELYFQNW